MSHEKAEKQREQYEQRILAYLKRVADDDLDDLLWVIRQFAAKAMNEAVNKEE